MDLLRGKATDIELGDVQEAAFLKITEQFTLGETSILRHYDTNRPALVETDATDLGTAGNRSQKFEDRNLHPVSCLYKKLTPVELNYNVFDKEILAIGLSLWKWRNFRQGATYKIIVYSYHQNLTNFITGLSLNRR
jgi:hypothetical protein